MNNNTTQEDNLMEKINIFFKNNIGIFMLFTMIFNIIIYITIINTVDFESTVVKRSIKKTDSLRTEIKLDNKALMLSFDSLTKKNIYDFVIMENDLDKGNISLTQIKESLNKK